MVKPRQNISTDCIVCAFNRWCDFSAHHVQHLYVDILWCLLLTEHRGTAKTRREETAWRERTRWCGRRRRWWGKRQNWWSNAQPTSAWKKFHSIVGKITVHAPVHNSCNSCTAMNDISVLTSVLVAWLISVAETMSITPLTTSCCQCYYSFNDQ